MSLAVGNADIVLTASAVSVIVCPSNQSLTILKVTAVNTDAAAHTINVYRVPNGGSAGVGNLIIDVLSIAPNATVVLPLSGQVLVNQQSLQALASTAAVVNINASYATTP